jgi:hypothetical protein
MAEAIEQVAKGSIATSREAATFMVIGFFGRERPTIAAGIRLPEQVPVAGSCWWPSCSQVMHAVSSVVAGPSEEEIAADLQAAPESQDGAAAARGEPRADPGSRWKDPTEPPGWEGRREFGGRRGK